MATDQAIQLPIIGRVNRKTTTVGFTLVLDDEFTREYLMHHTWNRHSRGYIAGPVVIDGIVVRDLLHRIVYRHYKGPIKIGLDVDHIDRNKLNNVPSNLRTATRSMNLANIGRRRNNTSGFHGVSWFKYGYKNWKAEISVDKHRISLGYFADPHEAAQAVNYAYQKYFPDVQIPNP